MDEILYRRIMTSEIKRKERNKILNQWLLAIIYSEIDKKTLNKKVMINHYKHAKKLNPIKKISLF